MSKRFTFTFTDEQVVELLRRAKANACHGKTDREQIYLLICHRENFEPIKHGGRREEAIVATTAYQQKKRVLKKKKPV